MNALNPAFPCSSEPSWAPGFVTLARAQYNYGEVTVLESECIWLASLIILAQDPFAQWIAS